MSVYCEHGAELDNACAACDIMHAAHLTRGPSASLATVYAGLVEKHVTPFRRGTTMVNAQPSQGNGWRVTGTRCLPGQTSEEVIK
jgi:hypothetical protein